MKTNVPCNVLSLSANHMQHHTKSILCYHQNIKQSPSAENCIMERTNRLWFKKNYIFTHTHTWY